MDERDAIQMRARANPAFRRIVVLIDIDRDILSRQTLLMSTTHSLTVDSRKPSTWAKASKKMIAALLSRRPRQ
jgi:hypothetical protein